MQDQASPSTATPGLATLLAPVEQATFFEQHWDRAPLHVARADVGWYRAVLDASQIDFILGLACQSGARSIEVLRSGDAQQPPQVRADVDLVTAYSQFTAGATLRVNGVQRFWQPLSHLCRQLEDQLSFPVRANLYCTPPDARGLQRHFDPYDVLVLQIAGRKRWRVFSSSGRLPVPWSPALLVGAAPEVAMKTLGLPPPPPEREELLLDATLETGDLLYVPRGFAHEVWTEQDHSAHITISLQKLSWVHLFVQALVQAAEKNPQWCEALPLPGTAAADWFQAQQPHWQDLVAGLATADLDQTWQELIGVFGRTRPEAGDGALLEAIDPNDLTLTTELELRPGLVSVLLVNADEVVFAVGNRKLYVAPAVAPALHYLRDRRRFVIGELPGLDDAEQLSLARRLVRQNCVRRPAAA